MWSLILTGLICGVGGLFFGMSIMAICASGGRYDAYHDGYAEGYENGFKIGAE